MIYTLKDIILLLVIATICFIFMALPIIINLIDDKINNKNH